jgi:transcription antitermination factor NusG
LTGGGSAMILPRAMAYWAVVRAIPQHERLAAESVGRAGFETFIPRIRARSGSRWRTIPLFGVYFFARIEDRWRAIERAMGVLDVVKFGAAPARCPDEEIAKLIARADPDGVVRLQARPPSASSRTFAPGAHVAIANGPFAGLDAIHTGMTAHERELVLLHILGARRPVEIAAGLLAPH